MMAGYQLKITLEYTRPSVWRRVIVPDRITFGDLHKIIQAIFGWKNKYLHDFSFPADLFPHIRSIEGKDSSFPDDLDEDQVYFDEYIEDSPWIRYTYNLASDWKHKIVLEEIAFYYEERYPQVVKYKGNNLLEDIWDMEEKEEKKGAFYIEQVNTWMKKNFFFEPVKQAKEILDEILDMGRAIGPSKRPEDFITGIREIIEQRKNGLDENTLEILDETVDEIQMLLQMISGNMSMSKCSATKKKLEQIEWYYPQKDEYSPIGVKGQIVKAVPKRSWEQVLLGLQKEELQELCEILKIHYAKSWNKGKLVTGIVQELLRYPEILCYFLNTKGLKSFLDFAKAPEGNYDGNLEVNALKTLLWWGYLDIEFQFGVESEIVLSIPEEVTAILEKLVKENWKWKCNNIEKIIEEVERLLQYYGCMELQDMYKIYTQVLRPVEEEMFYHDIYLVVNVQELKWYLMKAQTEYLCFKGLHQEIVMQCRRNHVKDMDYYNFTLLDVERWKKGLGAVYPEWKEFTQFLYDQGQLPKEDVNTFIELELYPSVMEGLGLEGLVLMVKELIRWEGIAEELQIWEYLQRIFLYTRLAGLKGYTRKELAEKKKENPFEIEALEKERKYKKVKVSAHMYETSPEYQRDISEAIAYGKNSPGLAAEMLEGILEKYNKKHYEGRYLLAIFYYKDKKLEKAFDILGLLVRDTRDRELKQLLIEWEKEKEKRE